MLTIASIFIIVGIILCALAAFNVPAGPVGLFPLGVAFFMASFLVGRV